MALISMRKILLTAASLFLLSGCATVFNPSNDIITVHAQDNDTKIFIDGNYMGNGNVTYPVARGKSLMIAGEKKGCAPVMIQTQKTLAGITLLNVFFWPGFIIDAATGAIQKTDPVIYNLRLNCD